VWFWPTPEFEYVAKSSLIVHELIVLTIRAGWHGL
jgi:hypothetical protein